jgi:hypothetical protein
MALVGDSTVLNAITLTEAVLDDIEAGAHGPVDGMRVVWIINGEHAGSTHGWKTAEADLESVLKKMATV